MAARRQTAFLSVFAGIQTQPPQKSEQAQEPWPVAPPVSNFAREHTAERVGNQERKSVDWTPRISRNAISNFKFKI
jgi:hypothetical protein